MTTTVKTGLLSSVFKGHWQCYSSLLLLLQFSAVQFSSNTTYNNNSEIRITNMTSLLVTFVVFCMAERKYVWKVYHGKTQLLKYVMQKVVSEREGERVEADNISTSLWWIWPFLFSHVQRPTVQMDLCDGHGVIPKIFASPEKPLAFLTIMLTLSYR